MAEYNFTALDSLSSCLIPSLDWVLKGAGLTAADIDVFGIAVGPGLFTGIRVGMAALKGLLLGMEPIAVVPVVSLKAIARKHVDLGLDVFSMIDARRNEIYVARYDSTLRQTMEPALIHINQLPDHIPAGTGTTLIAAGSGAEVHRDTLAKMGEHIHVASRSPFTAPEIAQLALAEFLEGNHLTDLQALLPLYIRKPDAEQNYRPPAAKPASK